MELFEVDRSVFWGTQREVFNTRQKESADESFESIMCEVVTDRTDLTELEVTSLACTGSVLCESEFDQEKCKQRGKKKRQM